MRGKCTDVKNTEAVIDIHRAGFNNKEICTLEGLRLQTGPGAHAETQSS